MSQAEWGADIFRAAEELHYHVLSLEPGEVRLMPTGRLVDEVTVRSVILSGDLLRELLKPAAKVQP